MNVTDGAIAQRIRERVAERGQDKTCCPSEIARDLDREQWRDLMSRVRDVAFALARSGVIEVRQGGQRIAPECARGAIRLGEARDG